MPQNQTQIVHSCFDPIVDKQSEIIIIGSLPGPESLASGEYYKKLGNSFWPILFNLFGEVPTTDYDEKCKFLLKHKVAVWDVFHSATREGAADSAIRNEVTNDFNSFFAIYPNINGIIFNGIKAKNGFEKNYNNLLKAISHEVVWSSSGACAKTFATKYENWKSAIERLSYNNKDVN